MLTGLFWDIEHDAFYKPLDPVMRGIARKPNVRAKVDGVYDAFSALEQEVEKELVNAAKSKTSNR